MTFALANNAVTGVTGLDSGSSVALGAVSTASTFTVNGKSISNFTAGESVTFTVSETGLSAAFGGEANSLTATKVDNLEVVGGDGDDTITITGDGATVNGGEGADKITIKGKGASVTVAAGKDTIELGGEGNTATITLTGEDGVVLKKSDGIEENASVAVHVRRGDFVDFKWALAPAVYARAIGALEERLGRDLRYFIFSDDMDYCETHLEELGLAGREVTYVTGNKGPNAYIDMQLMALCRHRIVSNSSFSYLAALLRQKSGLIVGLAPGREYS